MGVRHRYDFEPINSLATERCRSNYTSVFIKHILQMDNLSITCEIGLRWVPQGLADHIDIGQGNGLVLSGNKPLPEPMLTQICAQYGITRPQRVKDIP